MKLLIVLCFVGMALGAVFQSKPSTNPDHPGQCWLESVNVAIKPGESFSKIGECVSYDCHTDLWYSGKTCGVLQTDKPGCKVVSDNTLLYPECCPKVVCEDDVKSD